MELNSLPFKIWVMALIPCARGVFLVSKRAVLVSKRTIHVSERIYTFNLYFLPFLPSLWFNFFLGSWWFCRNNWFVHNNKWRFWVTAMNFEGQGIKSFKIYFFCIFFFIISNIYNIDQTINRSAWHWKIAIDQLVSLSIDSNMVFLSSD